MKTSIIETGTVIETRGMMASVRIDHGYSCRGCGMGKLGLCKPGGAGMVIEVENREGAHKGDRVTIGLQQGAQLKGYFFAYMLPIVVLAGGTAAGYALSSVTGIRGLDVISGFAGLAAVLWYSLKKVRDLDQSRRMHIKRVLQDVPEFYAQGGHSSEAIDYLSRCHEFPEDSAGKLSGY
jgi:positive regulator of sigma E activity